MIYNRYIFIFAKLRNSLLDGDRDVGISGNEDEWMMAIMACL